MKLNIAVTSILLISGAATADLARDVQCREIAFSQSVEQQNIAAFESLIDNDARFVGASVQRGAAEVTQAWSVFFAADGPRIRWRPQIVEVLNDGTLALSRGPYELTVRDADGNLKTQWGTFNSVWRMQSDGSWKVVFDAGTAASDSISDEQRAVLDAAVDCSG